MKFPWWLKLACKLILARLPFGYGLWRRLGIFRHGTMEIPEYAFNVFKNHYDRVDFSRKAGRFIALELGPGDAAVSGMIAAAHGASRCYLVDTGDYATRHMKVYQAMAKYLKKAGVGSRLTDAMEFEEMLARCGTVYVTKGLASLRQIPDETVDFIWSQAVLEHIRISEFADINHELRRILRPDGACSHRIDLTDHLGGALNNLRFSQAVWESDFFSGAGFYTNRVRYGQMLRAFEDAGFTVQIVAENKWRALPTPPAVFAKEFRTFPEEDLRVFAFDVILRPAN